MTKPNNELRWTEINPGTMHAKAKEAYDTLMHANERAKAAREKFQEIFAKDAGLPSTHRLLFSYKFGRLSVAIDLAKEKPVGSKAVAFEAIKEALRTD